MPNRETRILQVIPHLGPGGSERVLLTLLNRMQNDPRYAFRLCVLSSINAFPERVPANCRAVFLDYRGSRRDWRGARRCRQALRRLIRSYDPDVVHSHLWPACRMAAAAARGHRAAHVFHVHDTRPWLAGRDMRSRWLRFATRRAWRRSGPAVVAVSEAVRAHTSRHLNIPLSKIRVLHNFVDTDRFCPTPEKTTVSGEQRLRLGVVGLLKPEKGHAGLLTALKTLVAEGLDLELRLAGSGSLEPSLRDQCAALGLRERVRFMGLVADIPAFLRELDLLALPSAFGEGLPMTVLEGMAAGLPVVATDVAGTREALTDGENGLLVPPGRPDRLAAGIRRLAASPSLRHKLSLAARRTVEERFSLDAAAQALGVLYDRLSSRAQMREKAGP